jgi:predicted TIM-barrel fold metal-dependent hydrolase
MTNSGTLGKLSFVDAHAHLYDSRAVRYGIFDRKDPAFEALVGDYSALPRTYLLDAYLKAAESRKVDGIIWHEFISVDPLKEIAWAETMAKASEAPMALVGLVDFADPDLPRRLDIYGAIPNLTAVRQHLGWDEHDPLRRMASRPDFMTDPTWLRGLGRLKSQNLRCGLEVFAPQLAQLLTIVRAHPDIGFTIAVMGWPTDLGHESYARWRSDMAALGRCENTCASISAVECIFGMNWTAERVAPWIMAIIEAFGPKRTMFGSHLPIDTLSHGFDRLYDAYEHIVQGASHGEKDAMFRTNASRWYRTPVRPTPP